MARYIALLSFTETGAKAVKESTKRAKKFDRAAEKAGVIIEGQYWTIGSYDGVLIIRADSEAKALHWLTELAATGAVKTQTMQAFLAEEFDEIVGK